MNSERELFKQAYLNLRTADSIPFPDAVFDEFLKLRQGYKLVPVEPESEVINKVSRSHNVSEDYIISIYKAMIGAVDE